MNIADIILESKKELGKESLMLLNGPVVKVPCLPTGIPVLDIALGCGGFPKGRIIEVFGSESSGKTTLCLTAIASLHRLDKDAPAAFIDAEHALDIDWAKKIGVDIDRLIMSQPDSGEEGLKAARYLVEKGVPLIIVDSVSALTPQAELNGEIGDAHVGLQARMMSQAMRILRGSVSKNNCILIFINQIRMKIGVRFGSPITTSGGNALKFYASVRIDINGNAPKEDDKDGDVPFQRPCRIKIAKNKVGPPFKICQAKLHFEHGFDLGLNMLDALIEKDIITKTGNTYHLDGEKLAVGRLKVTAAICELPIEKKLKLYDKLVSGKKKKKKNKKKKKDKKG